MALTARYGVENIERGEGGVTAGDIDLLFEDADNELRELVSFTSRYKFQLSKLMQKLTNMVEQLEFHHGSKMAQAPLPFPEVGKGNGGESRGLRHISDCVRDLEKELIEGPSRPPAASSPPKTPKAKKEKKK